MVQFHLQPVEPPALPPLLPEGVIEAPVEQSARRKRLHDDGLAEFHGPVSPAMRQLSLFAALPSSPPPSAPPSLPCYSAAQSPDVSPHGASEVFPDIFQAMPAFPDWMTVPNESGMFK